MNTVNHSDGKQQRKHDSRQPESAKQCLEIGSEKFEGRIVDTSIIDSIEKNGHHSDAVIAKDSADTNPNIPAIFIRRSGRILQTYESGSITVELPDVFVFKSNEHQRYEYESPVMGLQKCLRT